MKGQPFDTIQGNIEFDAKGDLKVADYVIWTVKDGKLQEMSSTP
jgi:ABC-type branched-subunit amino acid transport system substrate-binding protein